MPDLADQLNKEIEKVAKLEKLVKELRFSMGNYITASYLYESLGFNTAGMRSYGLFEYPEIYLDNETSRLKDEKEKQQFKNKVREVVQEVLKETEKAD